MADLRTMIVCDASGSIEGNAIVMEDNKKNFYVFYAKKDENSTETPSKIILTMPVGGEQNGLLRLPRVGERILVASQGNQFFLMAYLPDAEDMDFREIKSGEDEADNIKNSEALTLRYKSPNAFPKENKGRSKKGISEIKFSTQKTYWPEKKDTIKSGKTVDFPSVDRIDVSSSGDVITTAQNYNEINASRVGIFAGVQSDLKKLKDKATTPTDDVATNGLEILPQDIPDEFPKFSLGDVQIRADKKIMLSAETGIILRCGRSTITIDDTGICLKSGKIASAYPTPDDSSISITPRSGVSISGDFLGLSANIKYSISERLGGSISSLAGVTRINTHDFRVSTNATIEYANQCFWAGARGVEQALTYVSTITGKHAGVDGENADHGTIVRNLLKQGDKVAIANDVLPLLNSLFIEGSDHRLKADDGNHKADETRFKDPCSSMISVANIIFSVLPIVNMVLDMSVPMEKKQNKAYAESMNMINSALSYSVLAYLATTICTTTAGIHYNEFALKGSGDIDLISKKIQKTVAMSTKGYSPVAGVGIDATLNTWWKKALAIVVAGAAGGVAIWQIAETSLKRDVETMKDLQEL